MDPIAKLFVLDSKSEEVGRILIDIEKVIDMYAEAWLDKQVDTDTRREVLREQTEAPRSTNDILASQVSPNVAWYQKVSDGSYYLVLAKDQEHKS